MQEGCTRACQQHPFQECRPMSGRPFLHQPHRVRARQCLLLRRHCLLLLKQAPPSHGREFSNLPSSCKPRGGTPSRSRGSSTPSRFRYLSKGGGTRRSESHGRISGCSTSSRICGARHPTLSSRRGSATLAFTGRGRKRRAKCRRGLRVAAIP